MAEDLSDAAKNDRKGAFRLGLGSYFGLFAAVLAVVLPSAAIFATAYNPGGFFSFAPTLLETSSVLVLVGAALFILALFLYRRAFSALRKVDSEFALASFLCLLGSVGLVLILVAAAVVTGTASSLVTCIKGQPSHALSCLESSQPFGAYTAVIGFVLAWLGGLGVVFGLWIAGSRFRSPAITLGSMVYLFFLFVLLLPLVEFAFPFPGSQYLLVIVPVLSVAAPLLVLVGILPRIRADQRAEAGTGTSAA